MPDLVITAPLRRQAPAAVLPPASQTDRQAAPVSRVAKLTRQAQMEVPVCCRRPFPGKPGKIPATDPADSRLLWLAAVSRW